MHQVLDRQMALDRGGLIGDEVVEEVLVRTREEIGYKEVDRTVKIGNSFFLRSVRDEMKPLLDLVFSIHILHEVERVRIGEGGLLCEAKVEISENRYGKGKNADRTDDKENAHDFSTTSK